MMLKVFLVEDEFVVREGIKNNIDWASGDMSSAGRRVTENWLFL